MKLLMEGMKYMPCNLQKLGMYLSEINLGVNTDNLK